jgi:polar amino acid transport system permease protein
MNLINGESIYRSIISGLCVTLVVSLISLIIGTGLSVLMNRGLRSKNTFAKSIIIAFMQLIRGIPFLIQLLIVYYVLPALYPFPKFGQLTTAVIVLVINAAVNITDNVSMYSDLLENRLSKLRFKRLYLLFILRELIETIKNSMFISFLGIMELYRATSKIATEIGQVNVYLAAAAIYIIINLIIYFIFRRLKKKYTFVSSDN